jgi:hypothetical protein
LSSLETFVAEWMAGQPRSIGFYNSKLDEVPRRSSPCRYPYEVSREIERGTPGLYLSVQPYTLDNRPACIEKLFFEFDDAERVSRAWNAALNFSENLVKFYDVSPLILFSGKKGYHVLVWLQQPYHADTQEQLKAVYTELMRMILEGSSKQTFDLTVYGDIARLSRVPYSKHQKSGELCVPVTTDLEPYKLEPGFTEELRRRGLSSKIVELAVRNLSKPKPKQRSRKWSKDIRLCITEVLKARSVHEPTQNMKVAAVAELSAKGWGRDQIVQAFSKMEGFDERKTAYQVDHVLRRGYSPFRCATIKKLGGCLPNCPRRRDPGPVGDVGEELIKMVAETAADRGS